LFFTKINPVEIFPLCKNTRQSYEKTDTAQLLLLLLQITFVEAQQSAVHNPVSNAAGIKVYIPTQTNESE